MNPYDIVPYPSLPIRDMHPRHLYTVAKMHGIEGQDPNSSRILELGCADGGNLACVAYSLPGASCLGLDYSPVQIEMGRRYTDQFNIDNLELRCADIATFEPEEGVFHYVLAHGVLSWINKDLAARLLSIISKALAPNGLACISFNVLPGWIPGVMVRDVLQRVTNGMPPGDAVATSVKVAHFIKELAPLQTADYAATWTKHFDYLVDSVPTYIQHEYLEIDNHPLYFSEFHTQISALGLRYVQEADPSTAQATLCPETTAQYLDGVTSDPVEREQYFDILSGRTFRKSILCRDTIGGTQFPAPDHLLGLWIEPTFTAGQTLGDFVSVRNNVLSVHTPWMFSGISAIVEARPQWISTESLIEAVARGGSFNAVDARRYGLSLLIKLMEEGFVILRDSPASFCSTLSERPKAWGLSRMMAGAGDRVFSPKNIGVYFNTTLPLEIIQLCDGEHTVEAICEKLSLRPELFSELDQTLSAREHIVKHLNELCDFGFFLS